jgi:hypothetical protein
MLTSIAEVTGARRAKMKIKDLVIVALFSCTLVGNNKLLCLLPESEIMRRRALFLHYKYVGSDDRFRAGHKKQDTAMTV